MDGRAALFVALNLLLPYKPVVKQVSLHPKSEFKPSKDIVLWFLDTETKQPDNLFWQFLLFLLIPEIINLPAPAPSVVEQQQHNRAPIPTLIFELMPDNLYLP